MTNYIETYDKIAFHPGYYIEETFHHSGLTLDEFATNLGIEPEHLMVLIQGNEPLSVDMAEIFSKATSTSINYWLNLQKTYDTLVTEKLRKT